MRTNTQSIAGSAAAPRGSRAVRAAADTPPAARRPLPRLGARRDPAFTSGMAHRPAILAAPEICRAHAGSLTAADYKLYITRTRCRARATGCIPRHAALHKRGDPHLGELRV